MAGRGRSRVFGPFASIVVGNNAAAVIGLSTKATAITPASKHDVNLTPIGIPTTPIKHELPLQERTPEETPFMLPNFGNGEANFVQGLQSFPGVVAHASAYDPLEKLMDFPATFTDDYDYEEPGSHPIPPASSVASFIREVQLQHIKGPNDFFVKPINQIGSAWKIMHAKLNLWYNQFGENFPPPDVVNLVKGGHYVAFSDEESTWFRVVVHGWKPDGDVSVQLLDDGGFLVTNVKNIRLIRTIFCTIPMQGQHASIQMVDAEPWTAEEIALFKSDVEGKEFFAIAIKNTMDEKYAPFQTVGIVLLQIDEDGTTQVYTFGDRLKFGYSYGNI